MTAPERLDVVYCTDEDLAVESRMDFVALSAKAPQLAYGTDGYFTAADPWTLVSPSVDFAANGVASNMVVHLKKGNRLGKIAFPGEGEIYAVDSATATTLALRAINQAAGVGQPPGFGGVSAGDGEVGVEFSVRTLESVIEDVSYELNQRFGIDPADPFGTREPADIYDRRALRRAAVLETLRRLYVAENRTDSGDWKAKADLYAARSAESLAAAKLRWGTTGQDQPPTTAFLTRLSR